jgi:hypothetical protein
LFRSFDLLHGGLKTKNHTVHGVEIPEIRRISAENLDFRRGITAKIFFSTFPALFPAFYNSNQYLFLKPFSIFRGILLDFHYF